MCGVAPSCPAGGRRGASASPSACPPNTGVTNGRAVSAARAARARPGARCLLGTGSPLAHPASRPGVAPEPRGPPADGDRGAPLSVHRGGAQPVAPTLERDSPALAAARRHGAHSRLPVDAGASGVHAVSLRAVVLALHLRSGGTLRRGP